MAAKPVSHDELQTCRDAVARHGGNKAAAARELGMPISTLKSRLESDALAPPDGFRIKGTSTLYDAVTGEAKLQWVKTDADKQQQEQALKEAIRGFAEQQPKATPTPPPRAANADLLAVYPVGDHHLGMLSWHEETGADYDLSIGEKLLRSATDYLVGAAPPAETALIAVLGDFLHYDSYESVTPASKHQLDSDSRYPKMVRVAFRCLRYMVNASKRKHAKVHLIVELGNHDPSSAVMLREAMAIIFEDDPAVTVDVSPSHYHYFRFGKNLIGTHHGHEAKPDKLPLIMAADKAEDWGQTEHRLWLTGHIHHKAIQDYNGCTVESLRVLPPADAWAHNAGYRSTRGMHVIIFHRENGEGSRLTVRPEMLS